MTQLKNRDWLKWNTAITKFEHNRLPAIGRNPWYLRIYCIPKCATYASIHKIELAGKLCRLFWSFLESHVALSKFEYALLWMWDRTLNIQWIQTCLRILIGLLKLSQVDLLQRRYLFVTSFLLHTDSRYHGFSQWWWSCVKFARITSMICTDCLLTTKFIRRMPRY